MEMKIRKNKSMIIVLMIIIMIVTINFKSISYATGTINLSGANVSTPDGEIYYHDNGTIEYIDLGQYYIEFYESGELADFSYDIEGNARVGSVYDCEACILADDDTHLLYRIKAPSGEIYNSDGKWEVEGYPNQILAEAKRAVQNFTTVVETYFNKINIDINGVNSPKDDLEELINSLNGILISLNSTSSNQSTNNNSNNNVDDDKSNTTNTVVNNSNKNTLGSTGNFSLSVGNEVNINANGNAGSLSVGNNVNINANGSGGSLTIGDDFSLNIGENGFGLNAGGVNISFGGNVNKNNSGKNYNKDGYGAEFYSDGTYKKVVLPEGIFTLYSNGNIESIITTGLKYYGQDNGYAKSIQTASGSIIYGNENNIEKTNGHYETIMGEATDEYTKVAGAFLNYYLYGSISDNVDEENNQGKVNFLKEENSKNNIIKYVLLGVAFLVAFVGLVFGIIGIKKKNNQIRIKNDHTNTTNN